MPSVRTNPALKKRGDKTLKRLAQETGGRAFFPFEANDLAEDFRAIGRDLRTQFLLSYTSTNTAHDGTFRNIIDYTRQQVPARSRQVWLFRSHTVGSFVRSAIRCWWEPIDGGERYPGKISTPAEI